MTATATSLSIVEVDALECLYQHRLLSTSQLHEMLTPAHALRRTQRRLAHLADRGLASYVSHRGQRHRPSHVWHLTEAGAEIVEALPARAEARRKLISAEQAAGALQHHTLAVNDAGLAFLRSARQRGDEEFTWRCWRHELAHPLAAGPPRSRPVLIPDAVISYPLTHPDARITLHHQFLELDRATIPVDQLAHKLARFAQLYHHTIPPTVPGGEPRPAWSDRYPRFPQVLVLFAARPRDALERRLRTVLALCRRHPDLRETPEVQISLGLLEDLINDSPWAPIVLPAAKPDHWTNWLGMEAPPHAAHEAQS